MRALANHPAKLARRAVPSTTASRESQVQLKLHVQEPVTEDACEKIREYSSNKSTDGTKNGELHREDAGNSILGGTEGLENSHLSLERAGNGCRQCWRKG